MAKMVPQFDDEIDLIELIQAFWEHWLKYFILGIIGLILGLIYTHQHMPIYTINFKAHISHPVFTTNTLLNSSQFQAMLSACELNGQMPCYSLNPKTMVMSVTHKQSEELINMISSELSTALFKEVDMIIQIAQQFEGQAKSATIINNNYNNNILWTNQDLAQLNPDDVVKTLSLSFGNTKALFPNERKHGVIGILIGLTLAFVWMLAVIVIRQLRKS